MRIKILLCLFVMVCSGVQAQMLMLTGENRSDNVDVVNATDLEFQVVESMTATSDFGPITGIFGMSIHPITGELYVVYQTGSAASRRLGIMDQSTAAITDIGNCGNIIDIAFASDGNLYGSTGNFAPDYSFVAIDLVTGAQIFLFDYTPSSYGGGMAYNQFSGDIYYQNNVGTAFIDPSTFIETVGSPVGSPGETQAMIILTSTLGWIAHYGTLYSFNPVTEVFSNTGTSINEYHAFSFTNAPKPFITEGNSVTVTMSRNSNPTAFDLTLNAVDQQNDALTWSLLTAPSNGMAMADGTGNSLAVSYMPNTDYFGTDSFVVQVSDGNLTDAITVNVNIALDPQLASMQNLTGTTVLTCPQDSTLTLQGSETGFDYYLRNDADHSIADGPVSGNGNALDFQTGVIGETTAYHVFAANPSYALDFDGVDDDVVIAHSADFNFSDGLTVEAWVRPTDISVGNQEIFRKENNAADRILLSFQDNGTVLSFGIETSDDGYTELDVPINAVDYNGQWVHVVATFDDPTNAMRLYRNGVEIGNKASNGAMQTATNPSNTHIGSSSGLTEFFEGQMAALRVWNTAPSTQTEVDALLNKGQANLFTGQESGLVAYYAFYENFGSELFDVTGHLNTGAINGAVWTTGIDGGVGVVTSNTLRLFCPVYVDLNATGADDGSSWADAFDTVQEGVDASVENGLVLVAEGTYMITDEITIDQPLTIRGGFPTGGGMQNIENYPTIIDAFESITANRQRVMHATHTTGSLSLEGLTLQNGFNLSDGEGGAIRTSGDLTLHQVIMRDNNVTNAGGDAFGGAIYTQTGRIMMTNSQIIDNAVFASSFASGNVYSESGDVTVVKSTLSGNEIIANTGFATGGGISTTTGNITLVNSEVSNNHSNSQSSAAVGGGLMSNDGAIYVVNSLIFANQASTDPLSTSDASGGGMRNNNGSIHLINSAVVNNTALSSMSASGGGVVATDLNIQNSLLWDNLISNDGGVNFAPSEFSVNVLTTNHSLIKGLDLTADNGLDASDPGFDPLFADAMNADFSLTLGSPLIDAGDLNLLPADDFDVDGDADLLEPVPLDLVGMTRVLDTNIEIGPYEFQSQYFVGGTVSGLLSGNSIVLQNNNSDDLTLNDNGAFAFLAPVDVGMNYDVSILMQPGDPIQPCSVSNGTGTINNQDISDVMISCQVGNDLIFRNEFE